MGGLRRLLIMGMVLEFQNGLKLSIVEVALIVPDLMETVRPNMLLDLILRLTAGGRLLTHPKLTESSLSMCGGAA